MLKMSFKAFSKEPHLIESLMPSELFVLDLTGHPEIDWEKSRMRLLEGIQTISKHTRKFSLMLDTEIFWKLFSYDEWTAQALESGLSQVHLVLEIDVPKYTFEGIDHKSPYLHKCLYSIRHMNEKVPALKTLICLGCPPEQIHHLGPFIAEFRDMGHKEILLIPPRRRTERTVLAYRQLFEYLRLRGVETMWISFDYFHKDSKIWDMQTFNSFSGPRTVYLDVSNKCTHSCNFCGLYGPDAIEHIKNSNEKNREYTRNLMSSTLDFEKGREILENLPEITNFIQFGGVGDPMTHPHFSEFIRIVREKGIACEVLSNMDYFDEESIIELSRLGSKDPRGLHFIANVSGSNSETYLKTRPRQKERNFKNVMNTLFRLKEEREKNDGHGVYFTMMNVLNRTNYKDAEAYVRLSKEIGADHVFLKPMEIHIEYQKPLLVPENQKQDYAYHISKALKAADEIGMSMHDRESLEKVLSIHSPKESKWEETKTNEKI